jgi:hypothetical protein
VIAAYLDDVDLEIDAARRLVAVWIKVVAGLNLEARAALLRQAAPPAR